MIEISNESIEEVKEDLECSLKGALKSIGKQLKKEHDGIDEVILAIDTPYSNCVDLPVGDENVAFVVSIIGEDSDQSIVALLGRKSRNSALEFSFNVAKSSFVFSNIHSDDEGKGFQVAQEIQEIIEKSVRKSYLSRSSKNKSCEQCGSTINSEAFTRETKHDEVDTFSHYGCPVCKDPYFVLKESEVNAIQKRVDALLKRESEGIEKELAIAKKEGLIQLKYIFYIPSKMTCTQKDGTPVFSESCECQENNETSEE
ncbi:MAG: hypothetical protein HOG49_00080 [Candidatus Scalindua sp.]|jgi:hypothetical protein|nr:hypothetical protein [Candidatus Scalindua sp.]